MLLMCRRSTRFHPSEACSGVGKLTVVVVRGRGAPYHRTLLPYKQHPHSTGMAQCSAEYDTYITATGEALGASYDHF